MNIKQSAVAMAVSATFLGGAWGLSQVDPTPRPGSPADPRQADVTPDVKPGDMARTPRDFVRHAAIGGMFEVQSSQLALERTQNPEVRRIAQHMITDHTAANERLKRIAQSRGLEVPTELDERHAKRLDELRAADQNFDRAYVAAQKKAHMEAIALFEAGEKVDDAQVAGFARETLPTLREHLDMIEQFDPSARPAGDRQSPQGAGH